MAKIDEANLTPDATTSVRGSVVIHRTVNNGAVAQRWPPARGKWNTPGDFYRQQEFGLVARGAAIPTPHDLATAIEYAKGSSQVPRDILMMAAYGTLYELRRWDGVEATYYRMVAPNAQLILDQVTDTPGAMMWRSPLGWLEIAPGSNGAVLGVADEIPQWLPQFLPIPPNPVGPNVQPYWRDTNVYLTPNSTCGTALTTVALGANTQYFFPIMVPNDRDFTSIAFSNTSSVAASNAQMAIYATDSTDGGPSTKILNTANIATTSNGLKNIAINQPIQAGPYWLALWLSAALSVRAISQSFAFGQLGWSLGSATPSPSPYISRSNAFGGSWLDMTGVTFNLSTGGAAIPLIGIR